MRRRRLASFAALAAGTVLLAGCAADASADGGGGDGWSYESGDGETYTADAVPTRIVAHAYAAKALMEFGITPVGIYADGPISEDVGLRGVDFDGVEILGEEWGKIDVEKAASLAPDLIVGDWWPAEEAYSGLEGGVEESSQKLADLAPVVGASQGDSIVGLIEGYAELAESLGADPQVIDEARTSFEDSVDRFSEAAAAKPGLTALAVSPYDTTYAVAVPEYAPELLDFREWGLDVIVPDSPDADFPYWESLSFETADTYQPDLLLFDDRNFPANLDTLSAQPIANDIAAYAAGATTTWPAYWLHTYSDYAAELDRLTEVIEGADPNIGSE